MSTLALTTRRTKPSRYAVAAMVHDYVQGDAARLARVMAILDDDGRHDDEPEGPGLDEPPAEEPGFEPAPEDLAWLNGDDDGPTEADQIEARAYLAWLDGRWTDRRLADDMLI